MIHVYTYVYMYVKRKPLKIKKQLPSPPKAASYGVPVE